MAGANDKKNSDQLGGIARSFDQYEYVAVITPGAALLFGLFLVLRPQIPSADLKDFGIGTLGAFLIGAYVVGHILRAVGDVFEKLFWKLFGGMPSEWVLRPEPLKRGLLDEQQQNDLIARVNKRAFKFDDYKLTDDDGCSKRAAKFAKWQSVTRRIYIEVRDAKKSGRVDAFNRTYGMMIGITVALLIVAALLLRQSYYSGWGLTKPATECALAFVLALFSLYRAYLFGKFYARELYVSFLDVTKGEKSRGRAASAAKGGAATRKSPRIGNRKVPKLIRRGNR